MGAGDREQSPDFLSEIKPAPLGTGSGGEVRASPPVAMDDRPKHASLTDAQAAVACLGIESLETLLHAVPATTSAEARHLEGCAACRTRLAEMRRADSFLSRFTTIDPAPSAMRAPGDPLSSVSPGSGLRGDLEVEAARAAHTMALEDSGVRAAPLSARDDFPGFALETLVQFGGQGAVYRAVDLANGETVAIKALLGDALRQPAKRFRFEREVELTARLDHPCIVRVRGLCNGRRGRLGQVMEFVEGTPWDEWARSQMADGREGVRRIVDAMVRVSDAIAYAHQRAVLHRDLKPDNVIVDHRGVPRVLDFGLAKALDGSGASFATITGAFVGTLAYAAPEQLDPTGDHGDVRCDVWGLGMLLYQALAGCLPWDPGATSAELLRAIRETAPSRPTTRLDSAEPELDAIVLKALAKEPARRYQSASAFGEDLRRWLDGRPVAARFDSRWYVIRKTAWRHRIAGASALVALTLCAVFITMALQARVASQEMLLATAIRDTRTVDAHWARLTEARSIAHDEFSLGEPMAWSAFLHEDPALVRAGLAGPGTLGPVPSNPAYWALWEIYQTTPIVASFEFPSAEYVAYLDNERQIVATNASGVRWWSADDGSLIGERARGPQEVGALSVLGRVNDARFLARSTPTTATVFDARTGPLAFFDVPGLIRMGGYGLTVALARTRIGGGAIIQIMDWISSSTEPRASARIDFAPTAMIVDPTERFVIVASLAGDLVVIDARSGKELLARTADDSRRSLQLLPNQATEEVFFRSVNGVQRLAGDGDDLALIEVDPSVDASLRPARVLFSRQGSPWALSTSDGWRATLRHLDGRAHAFIDLSNLRVHSAAFAPEGRLAVLSLNAHDRVALLDLEAQTAAQGLARPSATAGGSETTPLHSAPPAPAAATKPITSGDTIFAVAFDRDGRRLLAASIDGTVEEFEVPGGRWIGQRAAVDPTRGVTRLARDGDLLFLGTHEHGRKDASVLAVDQDGQRTLIGQSGRRAWICSLELDPGHNLWSIDGQRLLMRHQLPDGQAVQARVVPGHARQSHPVIARLAHRGLVLVGPSGPGMHVVDEITLEDRMDPARMPIFRSIAVSPTDPDLFATGHYDGRIRLWRLTGQPGHLTVAPVRELGTHGGEVFALAFHPSGRLLASGSGGPERKSTRLWDVEHGKELAVIRGRRGIFSLAFSPDGRWLAIGGERLPGGDGVDGRLQLIDMHAPDRAIAGNLDYHLARIAMGDSSERPSRGADALEPDSAAASAPLVEELRRRARDRTGIQGF